MNSLRQPGLRWVSVSTLILLVVLCIIALWKLATRFGYVDFTGYWSATYLLHQGHNPYDPAAIMNIERTLAHSEADFVMMAWNPPTLFVFLLPLSWLSFTEAHATWFVINVIMLLTISLMLAHLYLPKGGKPLLGICLLAALFPQALIALMMGQVTLLVSLGLLSSMILINREHWFWGGFVLILTTVKPHIAFLAVPYLLLYMAYRRKWQGWLGLLVSGGICMTILFMVRPLWISDLMALLSIAPVNWGIPTIGGILSFLNVTEAGRYLVVTFLPLAWLLARSQTTVDMESAVALLTAITVPTTFYGWSYDQSILLIPIAHLFGWFLLSSSRLVKAIVLLSILISFSLNWIQRLVSTDEVYYFWLPVFWAVVYCTCFVTNRATLSIRVNAAYAK